MTGIQLINKLNQEGKSSLQVTAGRFDNNSLKVFEVNYAYVNTRNQKIVLSATKLDYTFLKEIE